MEPIHALITGGITIISAVFGIIKYVDSETSKAKQEIRAEIAELKAQHNATQVELKRISDTLLEIRTLLFGAKGMPGLLSENKDR